MRIEPNVGVGAELGSLINQLIATHDESARQGLIEDLASKERVLVSPAIEGVIAKANLAVKTMDASIDICTRRWASVCPDGWSLVGEQVCEAPIFYKGPCKRAQSLAHMSTAGKKRFAATCKAPWPCEDSCNEGHDYHVPCPINWNQTQNGFCMSAASSGNCPTMLNFSELDIAQRQQLAVVCGMRWSCLAKCLQDFRHPCPLGWTEVDLNPGFCVAPPTYTGDCEFAVHTSGMSDEQKQGFGAKCGVSFPCRGKYE